MSTSEPPRRRGLGCLLVAMGGLAVLGMVGLFLSGGSGTAAYGPRIVEEIVESPPEARRKLAIVDLHGVLLEDGDGVTAEALAMLERAREDEAVAGVLLNIDTPGGSVTDADLLHREVTRLRAAGKAVVVLMGDLCASGGYYVAAAADEVWAQPTTVTGSIGVIVFGLNVHELLEEHGVRDVSVMSGPRKALFSPTRPVDEADRLVLQSIVDEMYARFVAVVAEGRELDEGQVRALADGSLFTATRAKEAKLVDAIGYEDEALDALRSRAKGGPFQVVRYHREPTLLDLLATVGAPAPPGLALTRRLVQGPRAMYLPAAFVGF